LFSLVFYLIIYILQTFIFIVCILFIRNKSTGFLINKINDLNSLILSNKLLSYILAINLFSMAGLPPLMGFFSKFYIFSILIQNGSIYIISILILMSCIGTFYYIRVTQSLFFNSIDYKPQYYLTIKYIIGLILILLTFINIFFCCFPWLLMDIIFVDV
jgi:NADH-quinone oxidoreductase subunit N